MAEDTNKGKTLGRKGKGTYIRLYAERWIHGSTREEMTNAERAVFIDLLALSALNDPPGQIDYCSHRRLAGQLNLSQRLLRSTIEKALHFRKIEVREKKVN